MAAGAGAGRSVEDGARLTILHQGNNPGGLEVCDGASRDNFVANIGDLLAQWTSDRRVSTPHRVVNPPRPTIAFFHQPNRHAEIACLPGCGEPRHAPTTSGAHFERKLAALRGVVGPGRAGERAIPGRDALAENFER